MDNQNAGTPRSNSNNPQVKPTRPSRSRAARMEPRARVGKNRGAQNFSSQELAAMLYAHGDIEKPLDDTVKLLDEIATDFIIEMAFEMDRSAELAGRQKVKLDDVKFACRKNPRFLGKIEEVFEKKAEIDAARKALDPNDDKFDKFTKSSMGNLGLKEEILGEADDEIDGKSQGGRSLKSNVIGSKAGK